MLLIAAAAAGQETIAVSGRVVDRQSLEPVRDVVVRIRGTTLSALTQQDGAFRIAGVLAGEHVIVFTHLTYGEHAESVVVANEALQVDVRISQQVIELTPVRVEALTELERRRVSSGNRMNEILRPEIDDASRRGLILPELLRQGMSGIRVWGGDRGVWCVEYRSATYTSPAESRARAARGCREVGVYMDGVKVSSPSLLFSTMPLRDVERLEVLSPAEAGARYGMDAGRGVLLIETRTGVRPDRVVEARRPTNFDWSLEQKPYPWARVLGSSLLGNAIGLGIGMVMAQQCLEVDGGFDGLRTSCAGATTVLAGFASIALPSAAGSMAARWAGSTDRSRGRVMPSSMLAATSVALGYMLLVRGDSEGSGTATTFGSAVLVLGTPVIVTLADRAMRAMR